MTRRTPEGAGRRRAVLILAVAAVVGGGAGWALQRSGAEIPLQSEEDLARLETPSTPEEDQGIQPQAELKVPVAALTGLPPYPGARPQGLGDGVQAAGVPFAVAWFSTADDTDKVLEWYRRTLEEAGLPVVAQRFGDGVGYVGYRDDETSEMHVVTVIANKGETLVFPSSGQGEPLLGTTSKVPPGLPHPPEATGTMVMSLHDGGNLQQSVVAAVPMGAIEDLVSFYRTAFREKGWQVTEVIRPDPDTARIDATRGASSVQALVQRHLNGADGPFVQLYVLLTTRA